MTKKTSTDALSAADQERLAAMADAAEAGEFTPVPGTLRMGRPTAAHAGQGKSPIRTVRLPSDLDQQLSQYASGAHSTPSEVVRRAVAEYMHRHPLSA